MMELYQTIGAACGIAGLAVWAATLFYGVLATTRDDETPKPDEQPTALARYRGRRRP